MILNNDVLGTALVLAKMEHEKITDGLKQLCSPQVEPLNKVCYQGGMEGGMEGGNREEIHSYPSIHPST